MSDGVAFADVGEELVAEAPRPSRGAAHEPGDVDEGEPRRDDLLQPAICVRISRRGSGTATSPTLGSMVQNG